KKVAYGVMALTKNEKLGSKQEMMLDSLKRIKQQPKAVWAVKMADRICNLYAPPYYWTNDKKVNYQKEALLIYEQLQDGNEYLAKRLKQKIDDYSKYLG
ncbi:MAG: bifunctional (p)ppGpp synthetase/guanosine-3',5'-bis(diphosphate) 3'-pyrophosphohydrolase, partial [Bacteroidota bacterium]